MSLRIRLAKNKGARSYRIAVLEKRSKRDGKNVETIGTFIPSSNKFQIDKEKYQKWINQGASPSKTVKKLLSK